TKPLGSFRFDHLAQPLWETCGFHLLRQRFPIASVCNSSLNYLVLLFLRVGPRMTSEHEMRDTVFDKELHCWKVRNQVLCESLKKDSHRTPAAHRGLVLMVNA